MEKIMCPKCGNEITIDVSKAIDENGEIFLCKNCKWPILLSNDVAKHFNWAIIKPNNIIEIKNTNSLTLLLKHLNSKIINKLIIRDGQYNNYTNIDLYNTLWDIYTNICYKFLIKPTIQRYSIFTGINKSTFNRWTELSNPNDKRRVSIKKWLNECESVLYDDAINTGNVGCLFALKCNYGYKESVIVETNNNVSEKTIEEIAMDYANQIPDTDNKIDF